MEQKHIEKIKSYYDTAGEFKKNEMYPGKDKTVYTKDGDKYHWLAMEPEGPFGMKVTQTDAHGRITARGAVCQWHTLSTNRSGAENIRKRKGRCLLQDRRASVCRWQGDGAVFPGRSRPDKQACRGWPGRYSCKFKQSHAGDGTLWEKDSRQDNTQAVTAFRGNVRGAYRHYEKPKTG